MPQKSLLLYLTGQPAWENGLSILLMLGQTSLLAYLEYHQLAYLILPIYFSLAIIYLYTHLPLL